MNFPLLSLSWKSLMNRKVSVFLTLLSLALSVMLFAGVEKIRQGARAGFETTVAGTDLIVGARTGQINLLLYTVFRIGEGVQGISWEAYEEIADRPEVVWTIPMSLGDSHKSFRVLGTTNDYFEHYKYGQKRPLSFVEGRIFSDPRDVVLGAGVAKTLDYQLGDEIRIAHGLVATSFAEHKEAGFVVTGILAPTGTPVDQTVHVSLAGLALVHDEDQKPKKPVALGAKPKPVAAKEDEHEHDHEDDHADEHEEATSAHDDNAGHDHEADKISAFLVGLKNPALAPRLQYGINTQPGEALMAVMPAVTLGSLWQVLGAGEKALLAISGFVIIVGLLGMLTRILTSLSERRREMAILRALGARPHHVFSLLMAESALTAFLGAIIGLGLLYLGFWGAGQFWPGAAALPAFEAIAAQRPGMFDLLVVAGVTALAALMAVFPAWKAYRDSLGDGLTIRV